MKTAMTSLERVLVSLGHQEPDRVPLVLLLTMHGAKELGVSIREYFSSPELVAEGQIRMRKKYRNDCIYSFFYAPIEIEAFGGEVIYSDDGPPNSATPVISGPAAIRNLEAPRVKETPVLHKVLRATRMLKEKVKDEAPIIGVVMSPFSLPVMQMGFDHYFDLMYHSPDLFQRLMKVNEEFCVDWANSQLEAGATAICYFDPVSSATIISRKEYLEMGFPVAKRTIARIKGPTATHFASGRCLPIIDDVAETGTAIIGTSVLEDIAEMKQRCKGKLTVLGNLNGIEMCRWTPRHAFDVATETIRKAGSGGGFLLSDNHGEIPFEVQEDVLLAISEAIREHGAYPLQV